MKFDVVVNPAGAGGKTKRFWDSLEPQFHGVDYEVHYSTLDHGIKEIVSELTSGTEMVNLVIVGGDGSMNEAVNGIRDFNHVRLGLLPSGSANDLAKDIGVSEDPRKQVQTILEGRTVRSIDVGEIILHPATRIDPETLEEVRETEAKEVRIRFNVSAGIGWDAEICRWVQISKWKKPLNRIHLGKLIYIAEAIRTVFAMKKFDCLIMADDRKLHYEQCVFGAFMNHRYEGGGFMFGPHASNQDGILDLCAVDRIPVADFFRMFPLAYSGRQFETPYCFETQAHSFHVTAGEPVWVHTDGEVIGRAREVTIHLLKEKLNLLF